jgi:hypothetical protein
VPARARHLVFENRIEQKRNLNAIKIVRAYGGCLGTESRRRTWQAAISRVEPQAGIDARISEWGNPTRGNTLSPTPEHIGCEEGTRGNDTSEYPEERKESLRLPE